MGCELKKYPMCYSGVKESYSNIKLGEQSLSKSAIVGNITFLSSFDGRNLDTGDFMSYSFEEQTVVCLDNIRLALEEAGSSLENLVKTYILLPNPKKYLSMREIELKYYQKYAPILVDEPPASTVIHPLNLASPTMLIEIEAIAFLPDNYN